MYECRTEWSKTVAHAMVDRGLTPKKIMKMTGHSYPHIQGVLSGRISSPRLQRKISQLLGIPYIEE